VSIGIVCRNCKARLKVAESAAGKLGKCPKCKQPVRVPKLVAPEAHFCDGCGKSLAEEEDLHSEKGKIFCGQCFKKLHGGGSADENILEQIGLNIPGLVIVRGKQERQMARMLKDVAAKKEHKKGATRKTEKPAQEEPAPAEEPAQAEAEFEPLTEEELAEHTPPEKAPEELEPAPPLTDDEEFIEGAPEPEPAAEEPAPEPEPEQVEAPPAPEPAVEAPPAPAPKLGKGQRPADAALIKLLVDNSIVLEGELELALQYQRGLGKRLIPVLDDLKLTSEEDIAKTISDNTGLELCPPGELKVADNVRTLLDDEIIGMHEGIPLARDETSLAVAFPNPLDAAAIKELRAALGVRVIPKVCTWTQYVESRATLKPR
jgi:hypothetical protein